MAQSTLLLSSVQPYRSALTGCSIFGLGLGTGVSSLMPGGGSLGLMIAVVATGVGMVGPVLSYELLERQSAKPGKLLGQQAAAGNQGQALGSTDAGSLFTLTPMMPFWAAALILLVGAALSLC
ncbi:hypothetical protein [Roseateles sp.]|uniref:hypothetical protein n=1 Tax=Roseateles sp. TaxID=1971397 RepID=UPI0032645A76